MIKEKEYFEIIYEYLKNIKHFSKNNPDLLIRYYSILDEIYNILNIKYYYPPKMRIHFIHIINSLINHLNKKAKNNLNNIAEFGTSREEIIEIEDEEDNKENNINNEIMLNNDEIQFLFGGI